MNHVINQKKVTEEVKKKIYKGFADQAIESTGMDGLNEEPISFEISDQSEFVGAIVVQPFWEQLHIKYLFVEEKYRGQGIATQLMNHALEFGEKRGCHFAFVETMSFQAPEFYRKLGFSNEFSREGYAKNTTLHYLKKILDNSKRVVDVKQITRIGVYGVAAKEGKILAVTQQGGPFAGKLDFPGGGMEFGETAEQTLRREFVEEVSMEFDSLQLLINLSATVEGMGKSSNEPYSLYQIGLIYQVDGCRLLNDQKHGDLEARWIDLKDLSEDGCSKLLWKYRMTHY